MDIYTTASINRVIENARPPGSFLLDQFFPGVQTEPGSEEIHFDLTDSKPILAPFVSPLSQGKVIENEGYETKSFKPAYVKPKFRINPNDPIKRAPGERIGGSLSPAQRQGMIMAQNVRRGLDMMARRENVMASEALRLGTVTVVGENYPTKGGNFGRHSNLTKALLTTARWGESGVRPLRNLEDWAGEMTTIGGVSADIVVMDTKASQLLRDDPEYDKLVDRDATRWKETLRDGPVTIGVGNAAATFIGKLGQFELWQYNEPYMNDAGSVVNVLPDYTVIMGSRGPARNGVDGLEGTRCYGSIFDEKANWQAERFFGKSWLEEDPAVRWMLFQSAPLVVPYRPNASMCVTVR